MLLGRIKSCFVGCVAGIGISFSPSASAWVDLSQWKKPKVFDQAPSAETAQAVYRSFLVDRNSSKIGFNRRGFGVLALYPLTDTFVGGFIGSMGGASLRNIPFEFGLREIRSSQVSLEMAGLFALSNEQSVFISAGGGQKQVRAESQTTRESSITLTSYTVWSLSDELGAGVGISGGQSKRKGSWIPIVGGAWQPTPEFRLDGWLPAQLHARWKFSPSQSLFARVELSGDAGYAENFSPGVAAEYTLVGAQTLLGWSLGMPIGFATGFLRLDPALGFFVGRSNVTRLDSKTETNKNTGLVPLADLRLAVVF